MASSPVPIILVGKTEQIGKGVIAGLLPEYEGQLLPQTKLLQRAD
jgi:hypothetical protein